MKSPRYTILIANRRTGHVRRLTVARRPALLSVAGLMVVPVLMGLGARWSARTTIQTLEDSNRTLQVENTSYRTATGELATQISSLESAITQLSQQAQIDPAMKQAMDQLPAIVRARALGGAPGVDPLLASASSDAPGGTFGMLHDLLDALGARLQSVQTSVQHQQALAAATPSIWPLVQFWGLSSGFGNRQDPFGEGTEFHPGIDISADKGEPVQVTADGTVRAAGYDGGYGNEILVNHGFGISTRYAHLSEIAVHVGQTVHRGDVIGFVGMTGRATAPHLHYEILFNDRPINPLRLLGRP